VGFSPPLANTNGGWSAPYGLTGASEDQGEELRQQAGSYRYGIAHNRSANP
jgi:hypothetical protein